MCAVLVFGLLGYGVYRWIKGRNDDDDDDHSHMGSALPWG